MLARRQPGSVFKPFVYAAAFDNAVEGLQPIVTPATTVVDEPTTFDFDGKEYTPNNYGEEFHGTVTLREALTLFAERGHGQGRGDDRLRPRGGHGAPAGPRSRTFSRRRRWRWARTR